MSEASGCIFCRVVNGEVPAKLVDEGETWLAFRDVNPQAPTHILVIPRRHMPTLAALTAEDAAVMGELVVAASRVAAAEGVAEGGYRLVVNAGRNGGQSVDHIHFHLLAGRRLTWPPG
jgi:histidine triad (HIT) family protein